VSATNGKNNFAIVRKPSNAIEKAAPGAKRILSGMVADALTLTRKNAIAKPCPLQIVVVGHDNYWLMMMRDIIPKCFNEAKVVTISSPVRALSKLGLRHPDLLITADKMPQMTGEESVRILTVKNVNYPILVHSGNDTAQKWVNEYASQGFNVGFLAIEDLKDGLNRLKRRIEEMLNCQNIKKESVDKQ
jgi:CheY-like chemotaxis protein